jgi:type-F conjugative transfer system secretin TraK
MKIKILAGLLAIYSLSVSAEQIFQAKTGQTIAATISSKDMTRIMVSGYRVSKAFTASPITIKKDQATGQLYVIPSGGETGTFSIFITDSIGDTFNLLLTPSRHKTGDSIVIMPDKESILRVENNKALNSKMSSSYERTIMNLIQIMYLGMREDDGIGYQVSNSAVEVPLWKKMKVVLRTTYSNQNLNGYIFEITNEGADSVLLNESEFYKSGVLAVAIDSPSLAVGQSTKVYVVQENTTR